MRHSRLKSTAAILAFVILMGILAACGSGNKADDNAGDAGSQASNTGASASTAPDKKPVELVLSTFNSWGESVGLKNALAAYEKATGNKVRLDVYPDDQFINILKTKMSTDDAPDLFQANVGDGYIPFTFLEPLSGPWADKMIDSVKQFAAKDGQVYEAYATPLGYFGAIYNKKVFEKAGVKVPMMNYAELTAGLEKIKQTGATPLFIPGKEGWTYQMLQAVGGVYTFPDEDVEKIVKNEEKPNDVKTLVEFANRMLALKPYINDNHMTVQIPDGYQGLLDGKYGMMVLGDWLYADLAKTDPEKVKDLGMMPITLGDDYISGVVNLSGRAFGMPSNSKHKEEAKELINFLMEPDNFKIMVAPDQGASPYEGYATDQNPFQQEMQQLTTANQIPITLDVFRQHFPTFNFSDSGKPFRDIFADKPIDKAFDDWYKDYAQLNRTIKTPGW